MLVTSSIQSQAQRFTLDGSPELEQWLAALCRRVRRAVLRLAAPKLEALVLGGGYGRGQGGVLKTAQGDAPYNDLEFYVFLLGNDLLNAARYRRGFQRLERILSSVAGLHIELKVDSLSKLRRSPVSIFTYDLVSGHRIVFGSERPFDGCENHLDAARIPAVEATRLLLNRGSGLLLAKELLQKDSLTEDESDFVGRNIAKAKLALGDALLVANGKYHWDCLERGRRLRELSQADCRPPLQYLLTLHAAGIRFKLHPRKEAKPVEQFRNEHKELTDLALQEWLWLENRRLRASFSTLREYSFSCVDKCPDHGLLRNLALNVKTFGAGATFDRNAPRYPRERLFNSLPLLLNDGEGIADPETRRHLQDQLHTRARDWPELVAAYKQVWSCYG